MGYNRQPHNAKGRVLWFICIYPFGIKSVFLSQEQTAREPGRVFLFVFLSFLSFFFLFNLITLCKRPSDTHHQVRKGLYFSSLGLTYNLLINSREHTATVLCHFPNDEKSPPAGCKYSHSFLCLEKENKLKIGHEQLEKNQKTKHTFIFKATGAQFKSTFQN